MFFIYKILYIKDDINKKYIKFIYLGGFYINLFFVGFCIVVILGIRVAPWKLIIKFSVEFQVNPVDFCYNVI